MRIRKNENSSKHDTKMLRFPHPILQHSRSMYMLTSTIFKPFVAGGGGWGFLTYLVSGALLKSRGNE